MSGLFSRTASNSFACKTAGYLGQLKRTEIKHHFQRSRKVIDFFSPCWLANPLRRTHLGEKFLRSEACRPETSAHAGWMFKAPSDDMKVAFNDQHLNLSLASIFGFFSTDIFLLCSFSSRQRFNFLVVEGLLETLIQLSI